MAGNTLLRNILTLMSGTAAAQAVVFLAMPVLSRLYTPEQFGILASFTSVVALIAAVGTLKYDMAIMMPAQDSSAKILVSTARWVSIAMCSTFTVVMIVLAPWFADLLNSPHVAPWLAISGVAAFTITEISILGYWLNRKSKYKEMASNRVYQSGTMAITQVALGFVKPLGAGGLIIGTLVGQIVSIFGLRRRTPELRGGPRPTFRQRKRLLRRYRNMAMFNAPTMLIEEIRTNGINLLIAAVSVGALGQFSMAWRGVEVPSALISGALAQVFFQRISVVQPGGMLKTVLSSIKNSALFGIVPFVVLWWVSPWLFPTLFGAKWVDAGLYAQALVPWLFMRLVTAPVTSIFVATERQYISLGFSVLFTIAPIVTILSLKDDMMTAIFVLGIVMSVMLLIYAVLAVFEAIHFDRKGKPAASVGA